MTTLDEIRGDYEDTADDLRQIGEEEQAAEAEAVVDNIDEAITQTRVATGTALAGAEVKQLAGDIAGTYTLSSKEITLDPSLLTDGEALTHVSIHEGKHAENKREGDDEIIGDVKFEEALTESATARVTGRVRAYLELVGMVDEVASATDRTKGEIIDLFEDGKNRELNMLYDQTYSDDEALAKAA